MNIYLLKRTGAAEDNEVTGFVIVAGDGKEARELAAVGCGDEGPEVWKKASDSTCKKIGVADGKKPMEIMSTIYNG